VLLRDDFGWSKTALSGAYSLQQVESGLLGPAQGWIIDRFGPRPVMRFGIIALGIGFMLMSLVDSLAAFYAVFFIMALGATLSGFFPLTVAIVNWFRRRRSFAISFMSIGFAAGGLVVPIIAFSLEEFGWRSTAFASGLIIIAIGLPLVQVIRKRPEDFGEVVDGIREQAAQTGQDSAGPVQDGERDFTLSEAVRTPAFWFISFGHGSALLVVTAVQVHMVSHLKEGLGYSLAGAAAIYTVMTVVQIIGMLIGGLIGDRYDKRLIAFACMAMHTVGLLLAAHAVALPMVLGFAVLHGFAWGCRGPLMQAIRADYFGRANYGVIMGWSSLIIMVGTIAGPLLAGILADVTGSYESGFTVLALLTGLGSVFFLLAKRPHLPEHVDLDAGPLAERRAAEVG
jgi:MFS family permease